MALANRIQETNIAFQIVVRGPVLGSIYFPRDYQVGCKCRIVEGKFNFHNISVSYLTTELVGIKLHSTCLHQVVVFSIWICVLSTNFSEMFWHDARVLYVSLQANNIPASTNLSTKSLKKCLHQRYHSVWSLHPQKVKMADTGFILMRFRSNKHPTHLCHHTFLKSRVLKPTQPML